ncbi:MAG: FAD-binding oxidoreductase [Actinobacteria bacterium]|nr:MAG: FAD-binding oxidoreductase [Actinomycetota bacterium]
MRANLLRACHGVNGRTAVKIAGGLGAQGVSGDSRVKTDVLVIGGGAIGAACTFELARRGAEVTLLERGSELGSGCSAGSAGLLCPSHAAPLATPAALRLGLRWMLRADSPFYLRPRPGVLPWLALFAAACRPRRAAAATRLVRALATESLALHRMLAEEEELGTGFDQRGVLNVYETEAGLAAGRAEAEEYAADAGLPVRLLGADEARGLEPALGPSIRGATYFPEEAHCDSLRFVRALGEAAAQAGADVRTSIEVLGLRSERRRVAVVETTAGDLYPRTVVLAAGAWAGLLARELGLYLPLEGGKGYHLELDPPPQAPRLPVFVQEARVIATPLPGRLRLSGTLELAGLDLSVDRRRVEAVARAARRALPGLEEGGVRAVWRGLRPCTPDGLPAVGRTRAADNVVLATGHAMMGLTLAPVTGRLVAALVAEEDPGADLSLLDPDRFDPRALGHRAAGGMRPRRAARV